MSMFSQAQQTLNTGAGTAQWEIRTNSLTRSAIMEVGFTTVTASSVSVGLGRPATMGNTPYISFNFLPEYGTEGVSISQTILVLFQQVNPTVPVNYFRRVFGLSGIGNGIIWAFKRGLVIPVSGSLVLWNIAASAQLSTWVVTKE